MTRTALKLAGIGMASAAFALPSVATAQDFMPDLPEVGVLSDAQTRDLPPELRSAPRLPAPVAPTSVQPRGETTIGPDGVETITRTRRITRRTPVVQEEYEVELPARPHGAPHAGHGYAHGYAPGYAGHYSHAYAPGAQVFQREQWIDECERRTDGYRGNRKGGIIGGLLGAIAGASLATVHLIANALAALCLERALAVSAACFSAA